SSAVKEAFAEDGQQTLVLPLYGPMHTEPLTWQIRMDRPRVDAEGRPMKFETPGGGGRGTRDGSIPVPEVHPSQRRLVLDPGTPLIVTEGIVKGDAIISALRREGAPVAAA